MLSLVQILCDAVNMKYHLGALLLLFCGHLCSGWFKFTGDLRLLNPGTLQRYLRFGNSLSHWGYEHGANGRANGCLATSNQGLC